MSSMAKHGESCKETKAFADAHSEREERFIELRGVTFHCLLEGPASAPWMVFAHSLATDLTIWNEVAAEFAGSFRILRYDQRGHGKTNVPPGPYSFDILADDAAALMEFFDITNAVFAGVSMGAITALLLASRHSARLRAAIVCDGQPFLRRTPLKSGSSVSHWCAKPVCRPWLNPRWTAGFAPPLLPAIQRASTRFER